MKGYSAGMRRDLIIVQNRKEAAVGIYGIDSAGVQWEDTLRCWASVEWQRGKYALREGAVDAYGVVMVRMLWTPSINMRSRIVHDGQVYQILPETFHSDRMENTVQFLAQVVIND